MSSLDTTIDRPFARPGHARPGARADAASPIPERPVFFDSSGRRARVVRIAARLLAALMPTWLIAVVVGALTPLGFPALQLSIASSASPAARVQTAPAPSARPASRQARAERALDVAQRVAGSS